MSKRSNKNAHEEWMSFDNVPNLGEQADDPEDAQPDNSESDNRNEPVSLDDIKQTVLKEFDERTWRVMEAVLSVHATHLINGIEACFGLIIEGPSGCGKTTSLRPFEAVHGQFYRSDDITPASFVSHDSSKTEEELREQDLLPRIKHQTVLNPEMANWFSGDWNTRKEKMGRLVRVMDGNGFVSDSGTHGKRGYQGNYRFNMIGATTPLDSNDWKIMGHTGNRFLFHEMPSDNDSEAVKEAVFGETEYGKKIEAVREVIYDYLIELWETHDGPKSVSWESMPTNSIQDDMEYLAELIRHARAPIADSEPEPEDTTRVLSMLRDLARGHALLHGRTHIERDDIDVCSRVALSTMPHKRRQLIREVVRLNPQNHLKTSEVEKRINVSKPTAQSRMKTVANLNIGHLGEKTVQGGNAQILAVNPEFVWPDSLPYPSL